VHVNCVTIAKKNGFLKIKEAKNRRRCMCNFMHAFAQLHRFCPWCVEFGSLLASFFVCWLVCFLEAYLFKNLDLSESDVRMVGINMA